MRFAASLLALALLGAPALAVSATNGAPVVLHVQLGESQLVEQEARDLALPHELGPLTQTLAERTAGLPGPSAVWTPEGIVVSLKDSAAGALLIPHFLNAGDET
ncbi:MAG: hypothetical protein ACRDH5_13255, partial [bacterium]